MAPPPRRQPPVEDSPPAVSTGPRQRDSDWGGHPRKRDEDVAWAARRAAVSMAAATLNARDGGTGSHSDDVVHLCDAIADQLGIHGHSRAELLAAAQLHDIGKVAIPLDLLAKRGPLDNEEWELIRGHTVAGEKIIRSVPELVDVARLVRHSHERWDGGGYPDALTGEDIPLGSRIVFCADSFHAIRSDRPYRRGRSAGAALDEVTRNAGSQFDPRVAEALVESAGRMRKTARTGARGFTTTLRSRRLVTLLATLAIGGSALAAGGSFVTRDDERDPAKDQTPPAASPGQAGDGATKRGPAGEAVGKEGGGASSAPGAERARSDPARSSSFKGRPGRDESGAPASGAPARTAPPAGRLVSPGRSGEAPGRPAQPGRPVGGAPGRSEEAPGRPAQLPDPPARAVTPPTGPGDKPAAGAPGRARSR